MLILIVASLGSALFFVFQDRSDSKRAVKALALRVGLSLGLFLILMAGFYFGFIPGRLKTTMPPAGGIRKIGVRARFFPIASKRR